MILIIQNIILIIGADLTVKAAMFVGRVFVLEMLPFDFGEYLLYRDSEYVTIYEENRLI